MGRDSLPEMFLEEAILETVRYLKAKDSSKSHILARKLESNLKRWKRSSPSAPRQDPMSQALNEGNGSYKP